eukprot:scaffold72581_cov61-Phaeocystis_antarctica.AAC.1
MAASRATAGINTTLCAADSPPAEPRPATPATPGADCCTTTTSVQIASVCARRQAASPCLSGLWPVRLPPAYRPRLPRGCAAACATCALHRRAHTSTLAHNALTRCARMSTHRTHLSAARVNIRSDLALA